MFILGRWWRMTKKEDFSCWCANVRSFYLFFLLSQVFFCFAGSPTPADSPYIMTTITIIKIIIIKTQTLF